MLKAATLSDKENINAISKKIIEYFNSKDKIYGDAYIGFPVYVQKFDLGNLYCDLAIVSNYGIFIFSIDDKEIINYKRIQDELYAQLEMKFKKHSFLRNSRNLKFEFDVVTLCLCDNISTDKDNYLFSNFNDLFTYLNSRVLNGNNLLDKKLVDEICSALQEAVGLSKRSFYGNVEENTKAYLINEMNNNIEKYDSCQLSAITVDPSGIQRIRGMAGSGKTVIIARKAAELHSIHPDWTIVVTYFTRSLKNQFRELIDRFYRDKNDGKIPNYDKLKIMHAWGSSSSDGVYYDICKNMECKAYSYQEVKYKFGTARPFNDVCKNLIEYFSSFPNLYDCILIDEAQDFDANFIRLCSKVLDDKQRLVYAYDELQDLSELSMPSPEKIFGHDVKNDTPLRTCYRNQSKVIVTAHALGMGLYRKDGMIQIPSTLSVWDSIGYKATTNIKENEEVTLYRDSETSPDFLNYKADDLITIDKSDSFEDSLVKMISDIEKTINKDKIKLSDIMIIDLNGQNHTDDFYKLKELLLKLNKNINIHLAASTNPEDFFRENSIVFSSIYRAKGNESYFVFILNSQKCIETLSKTKDRNSIFTAITRSKGWVRLYGYGDSMDKLMIEFDMIKNNNYQLHFDRYPTKKMREAMFQTNQDLSSSEHSGFNTVQEVFKRLSDEDKIIALKDILGNDFDKYIGKKY